MKKRSKAATKTAKARPRKALKPKGRSALKALSHRGAAHAREIEIARITREKDEALEQQTATSEVLQVIGSSPGDLQRVFDAMLQNAIRICEASYGNIYRWDGQNLRLAAKRNIPVTYTEFRKRSPFQDSPIMRRVLATKTFLHLIDAMADPAYSERRDPGLVAAVEFGGLRTFLVVPLLNGDDLVGLFTLGRQHVLAFTSKQIALVTNFAAQAVIAIENARLLNELRQRTADLSQRTVDLTESLEQQTATAEVLQVISSSPGDLEPVFATMLEKAVRICDATFGNIYRWSSSALHLTSSHNTPPEYAEYRRRSPVRFDEMSKPMRQMIETKLPVQVGDTFLEDQDNNITRASIELGGIRTVLNVPMVKEDELVGAFFLSRREVRPFTDKQIALVTNFAAQAVIALENARLLTELRESLQEQTATSEVLQVISSSPGDLGPVFTTMLESAVRICDAKFGTLYLHEEGGLRLVAAHEVPEFFKARGSSPIQPAPGGGLDTAMRTKRTAHLRDLAATQSYAERHPRMVEAVELGGMRTVVAVPMLKDDDVIGVIAVFRREVRPFSDKQIALVENFAAQALIAIENARLLKELRARTGQVEALNQQLEQRVADQVGEIERMSRLRRFLPPQVADLIVASGTEKQLESHRREITALFCDLRGFTGFSEASAPEDVMTLLRDYHAAIGEIIIKYSGTLERYAGDGVMVVFNDPVPVDNPALRAVQMALETREAMGALTEKWRELGHDVGFGIGIAHGYATLGTIGFEGRFDYAAIGTVSNVASRLCDEAKPGQILISPRVFMAVKDAVTVEPVGEFTLKGIGRPLAAYNVLAAAPPNAGAVQARTLP